MNWLEFETLGYGDYWRKEEVVRNSTKGVYMQERAVSNKTTENK